MLELGHFYVSGKISMPSLDVPLAIKSPNASRSKNQAFPEKHLSSAASLWPTQMPTQRENTTSILNFSSQSYD